MQIYSVVRCLVVGTTIDYADWDGIWFDIEAPQNERIDVEKGLN